MGSQYDAKEPPPHYIHTHPKKSRDMIAYHNGNKYSLQGERMKKQSGLSIRGLGFGAQLES